MNPDRVLTICKRLGMSSAVMHRLQVNCSRGLRRDNTRLTTFSDSDWQVTSNCAMKLRAANVTDDEAKLLTETDKGLLHIARALVMSPEMLVMHMPLPQFNDEYQRLVVGLFREFVDLRGVEP